MRFGESGEAFLMHFGPDLVDFEDSESSKISSWKLEAPILSNLTI